VSLISLYLSVFSNPTEMYYLHFFIDYTTEKKSAQKSKTESKFSFIIIMH